MIKRNIGKSTFAEAAKENILRVLSSGGGRSATTLQTLRQIVLKKVGARHAAGSRTNFTEWTDTTKVNVPHF